MFFLHLLEQVHCTCPSFLTSMTPCPIVMCLPQKEQLRKDVAALLIDSLSPYLPGLTLSFSKHQDIIHPNGSLDIPCEDPTSVLTFKNFDPHLYDFASDSCPAHYLDDFRRDDLFFSCFATHLSVLLILLLSALGCRSLQTGYRADDLLNN